MKTIDSAVPSKQTPVSTVDQKSNCFDFIRILAAFGVLFSHSFALMGYEQPIIYGGQNLGTLSVSIFFSVSGFLVLMSWDRSKNAASFVANRLILIFPALVVCLLFCIFIVGLMTTAMPRWEYLANPHTYKFAYANLIIFGDYIDALPGVFSSNPFPNAVNGSLWTIRYEIFMYLTLLIAVVATRRSTHLIVAITTIYVFIWILGMVTNSPNLGGLLWRLGAIGIQGTRIIELAPFFLIGALISRMPRSFLSVRIAFSLIIAFGFFYKSPYALLALWATLPYCVLVFSYHGPHVLRHAGKFGDFSYGVYLYAFPVQQFLSYLQVQSWWTHFFVSVVITITLAFISWHVVESPALKFKRNRNRSPHSIVSV